MAHRIVDVSSNNPHPINWAAVKAAGVDAVMIKATEGTGYTNPYYAADRNGARAAGLLVAAYHFAKFTDAAVEATYFHAVAGADAKILDIEASSDAAWMERFLATLGIASSQEMTYGSASTIPTNLTRGLLWVAAWGGSAPAKSEALWQYSDAASVNGIDAPVDESEWLGSEAQYAAFFGTTPGPVTPPVQHITVAGVTVAEVQQQLNLHGANPPLAVDNIWGDKTAGAVLHFQQTHPPLQTDGVVGPQTWARLTGPIPTPVPPHPDGPPFPLPAGHWFGPVSPDPRNHSGTNNPGDQNHFKPWQAQMEKRGWKGIGAVDGIFGLKTETVCRQFQAEKRLHVDGLVGPQTWNAAWSVPVT